ncbi:MAG TPA: ABC transporter permease subunit [Ktedonobacterales bacterium]|jgi:ABC-type Na+ efflux pump permease subunit|nr:ABC transporter permease subunit [Ktedonobacterales bacterium]
MSASTTRIRALFRKELREYRRNGSIVATMAFLPLGIIILPLVEVIALPASAANGLLNGDPLVILLGIPAILPAILAGYAVVGEREQGTLEPVLTTPIRREELLLAKALAALIPTLVVAYTVYAVFLTCTKLFAQPAVASAVLQGPDVLVQVLFTPLLALFSIWVALAISTRLGDIRAAQQFAAITGLPALVVAYLIAFNVIPVSLGLALGVAAALLILDGLGWRLVSALFDRERLITGTR